MLLQEKLEAEGGDSEIDHQGEDIAEGGDQGSGSDGRVHLQPVQEERNNRSGDGPHEQREQEGDPHHDAQPEIVLHSVEQADDQQTADGPDDQADGSLLQDETAVLVPGQLP